jgi:hypothetical protein
MSENFVNCICKDNKAEQILMGTNIVNKPILRFKTYDNYWFYEYHLK